MIHECVTRIIGFYASTNHNLKINNYLNLKRNLIIMLDRTRWETKEKVLFSRHGQALEAHKYAFTLYVEEKQAGHRPQLGV